MDIISREQLEATNTKEVPEQLIDHVNSMLKASRQQDKAETLVYLGAYELSNGQRTKLVQMVNDAGYKANIQTEHMDAREVVGIQGGKYTQPAHDDYYLHVVIPSMDKQETPPEQTGADFFSRLKGFIGD